MKVEVKKINLKENTQSRVEINQNTVDEYAADLKGGAKFPPVVLYKNEKSYYVGDGWHRILAFKKAGEKNIDADIKQGTKRDAVLYSVGSNAAHGLRRTNEDKRKAVTLLLADKEWAQWSNREIARQSCVGEKLVRTIRKELSAVKPQISTSKKVKRGGKEYTINTENIGQNAKKAAKLALSSPRPAEGAGKQSAAKGNNDNAGFKNFKIFGWNIELRISRSKSEAKMMKISERSSPALKPKVFDDLSQ